MTAPLYVQIRREIEQRIHRGELAPGARLPTEMELAAQHGVSRATAQRVLNDLAEAGLAIRRRRHGTFVADVRRQIDLLNFVTPETAEKGGPGRHDVVSARIVRAADAVLTLPGAAADTAVVELVRRKLDLFEQPVAVERHVVLFSAAPDLLDQDLEEFVSLPYLRGRGVPVDSIRLYLDPIVLDAADAALLDSPIGTPTLMRRRELRRDDGSVAEVVTAVVRPGTAEFFVEIPVSDVSRGVSRRHDREERCDVKIIVVGSGVLGVSVARSLAVAGEEVHLVDPRGAGTGTSSTTFAWTNANRKLDPDYHRLNVAGMEEHAALAGSLPGEPSYVRSGALQWADAANEAWLADNIARLTSLGYPAHWITRDEAARVAGPVRIPASVTAVAHFPSEGYVLPRRFVQNLLADAHRHGATSSVGEVVAVDDGPDRVTVTLADGEVRTADRIVLAAGRWTEDLAATAGIDLPMLTGTDRGSPTVGLLGYVRSPGIDLRCVIHTPAVNLRPGPDGRAVVQALDLNAGIDPADPPSSDGPLAGELARRLSDLFGSVPGIDLRVGFRSLPADGHTIAGYASPASRVYCLVSHSAVTLAPVLGRLVATEIVAGAEQDLLGAFRPTRFAGAARSQFAVEQRPARLGEQ